MENEIVAVLEKQKVPALERFDSFGLHRIILDNKNVVINSAPNWDQLVGQIQGGVLPKDEIIIAPKLITLDNNDFGNISNIKNKVNNRITELMELSKNYPNADFIIGTPLFEEDSLKPKNGAIIVKNGKELARTHKRSVCSLHEKEDFETTPTEPPSLIPETKIGLSICSDLVYAKYINLSKEIKNRTFAETHNEQLINSQPFISEKANSLIVLSRWAAPTKNYYDCVGKIDPDEYFLSNMKGSLYGIFRDLSQLKEIVVCDGSSLPFFENKNDAPTKPFNAYFGRN